MPELGTLGSVRGALSNERPYRDRKNCQRFSTGFSSGHFGGSGKRVMLGGTASFPDMCQPA